MLGSCPNQEVFVGEEKVQGFCRNLQRKMVADFDDIDLPTIDRYLSKYADELKHNGYVLSKGKRSK